MIKTDNLKEEGYDVGPRVSQNVKLRRKPSPFLPITDKIYFQLFNTHFNIFNILILKKMKKEIYKIN